MRETKNSCELVKHDKDHNTSRVHAKKKTSSLKLKMAAKSMPSTQQAHKQNILSIPIHLRVNTTFCNPI